jgi:hypothetical protein
MGAGASAMQAPQSETTLIERVESVSPLQHDTRYASTKRVRIGHAQRRVRDSCVIFFQTQLQSVVNSDSTIADSRGT